MSHSPVVKEHKSTLLMALQVTLEKGDQLEVPAGKTHYAACVGNEPVTFVDASKY